jgi:hypothetical protein
METTNLHTDSKPAANISLNEIFKKGGFGGLSKCSASNEVCASAKKCNRCQRK